MEEGNRTPKAAPKQGGMKNDHEEDVSNEVQGGRVQENEDEEVDEDSLSETGDEEKTP